MQIDRFRSICRYEAAWEEGTVGHYRIGVAGHAPKGRVQTQRHHVSLSMGFLPPHAASRLRIVSLPWPSRIYQLHLLIMHGPAPSAWSAASEAAAGSAAAGSSDRGKRQRQINTYRVSGDEKLSVNPPTPLC